MKMSPPKWLIFPFLHISFLLCNLLLWKSISQLNSAALQDHIPHYNQLNPNLSFILLTFPFNHFTNFLEIFSRTHLNISNFKQILSFSSMLTSFISYLSFFSEFFLKKFAFYNFDNQLFFPPNFKLLFLLFLLNSTQLDSVNPQQFIQLMDIKVREALSNLAKQPPNPNLKKPDPLSIICAQRKKMRKTKVIQKQRRKGEKKKEKNTKLQNQQSQNKIKGQKQEINSNNMDWLKYLPNQCDQFLDMNRVENKNDSNQCKIQNNCILSDLNEDKKPISPIKQEKVIMPQIDYQLLKTQLGIGIKDQPKVKIQQKILVIAKQECPNPMLPFPGRAFEQAPPRPAPKRICEYPPTDKVAGLYPWPPPQSDYRRWKSQMRQSRKLQ